MSITINSNILTQNDCYKAGRTITPKGIMVHSTATPGATANNFIKSWNKSGVSACVHAFVDNTGIYQTLPWNWRGWHAASGKMVRQITLILVLKFASQEDSNILLGLIW